MPALLVLFDVIHRKRFSSAGVAGKRRDSPAVHGRCAPLARTAGAMLENVARFAAIAGALSEDLRDPRRFERAPDLFWIISNIHALYILSS
jgi:hypothetical protein